MRNKSDVFGRVEEKKKLLFTPIIGKMTVAGISEHLVNS